MIDRRAFLKMGMLIAGSMTAMANLPFPQAAHAGSRNPAGLEHQRALLSDAYADLPGEQHLHARSLSANPRSPMALVNV